MIRNRAFASLCIATVIGVGALLALRDPNRTGPPPFDDTSIFTQAPTDPEQEMELRRALEQERQLEENKTRRKQLTEVFLREKGRSVPNLYAAYRITNEDPVYLQSLRAMCDDAAAAAIVATMTNHISDAEHWRDIDPDNICADLQCAWARYTEGSSSPEGPDYATILEDIFLASTKPQYEGSRTSFDAALMEGYTYLGADIREQWTLLPQYRESSFSLLAATLPSIISKQLPEDTAPARRAELADALWKIATTVETGGDLPRAIEWEIAVGKTLSEAELLSVTGMRHNELEVRVRELEETIPDNDRFWAAMDIASEVDLKAARDVLLQQGDLTARRVLLERVDSAEIDRKLEASSEDSVR